MEKEQKMMTNSELINQGFEALTESYAMSAKRGQNRKKEGKSDMNYHQEKLSYHYDIYQKLQHMFAGAYEKANIWPDYTDDGGAVSILSEEVFEASDEISRLSDYFDAPIPINERNLTIVEARAISAICELLQVLAVCKKCRRMLKKRAKREDGSDEQQ